MRWPFPFRRTGPVTSFDIALIGIAVVPDLIACKGMPAQRFICRVVLEAVFVGQDHDLAPVCLNRISKDISMSAITAPPVCRVVRRPDIQLYIQSSQFTPE